MRYLRGEIYRSIGYPCVRTMNRLSAPVGLSHYPHLETDLPRRTLSFNHMFVTKIFSDNSFLSGNIK